MVKPNLTIKYYDDHAREWASKVFKSIWIDEINEFHRLLPKGKIIEFGCGSGRDAKQLASIGTYNYLGIDGSVGLLKQFKTTNPSLKVVKTDLEKLDFPGQSFDGFLAIAVLLHFPRAKMDLLLQNFKKTLKTGAVGLITMKAGAGEKTEEYTGRHYSYYSLDNFAEILTANGFEVIKKYTKQDPQKVWLLVYFVRV